MKISDIYIVMTDDKKLSNIILRIAPEVHDEFKAAVKVLGATKSGLLHQYIHKVIHETQKERKAEFEKQLEKIKSKQSRNIDGQELAPNSKKKILLDKTGEDKSEKKAA